jgi:hypothetical protein
MLTVGKRLSQVPNAFSVGVVFVFVSATNLDWGLVKG